jgi:hypothetical protein
MKLLQYAIALGRVVIEDANVVQRTRNVVRIAICEQRKNLAKTANFIPKQIFYLI